MKILLLIILISTGCAHIENGIHGDSEFNPYIEQYYDLKHKFLDTRNAFHRINIRMAILDPDIGGFCIVSKGEKIRQVVINYEMWELLSELNRLTLILHELGHCDLDLNHSEFGIMQDSLIYVLGREDFYYKMLFLYGR